MSTLALKSDAANVQHPYIERRAGVVGGEPVITGTRVAVRLIAGWHRMGLIVDAIVAMYPHLNDAQVYDALSYYYDHKDEIEQLLAEHAEDLPAGEISGATGASSNCTPMKM
ncbi:MAG: DUF433 domain-containing protein [Chloroflexi bacterium]|nr:DUF433 domain-containing protein [Chloroflexota bacterium]MBI3733088.1 DUF433 domain-containing protein [Chloroflexota bacterium]